MRELVLVGGGHSHVQVLRHFTERPEPGLRLTVVVDRPVAVYSGMVPGWVAGDYRRSELEIDVWALARRAGARLILARATGLDPQRQRLELEGRPSLPYDLLSIDIGASVMGLEKPGVRQRTVASRPIVSLLDRLDAALPERPGARLRVVGGGAAGVELAFCLEARLRREGRAADVQLLDAHPRLLRSQSEAVVRRVRQAAERRGIALRAGVRVAEVLEGRLLLEGGGEEEADLVLWVTGAAPHLFTGTVLRDRAGFLEVEPSLQLRGLPGHFAAGDCAAFSPALPKAGVYAVRQGPVLAENLRRAFRGESLHPYRPQADFLALLNLGDRTAIGGKWGGAVEGAWVWQWKDRIDRRFMAMFQALDADDKPRMPMQMAEVPCAGCAAKLGGDELEAALASLPPPPPDPTVAWGTAAAEDVALLRPGGPDLAWNLDAFVSPITDPWWAGKLGAANALSDLHAKGVQPRWAMALVGLPAEESAGTLEQLMAGARELLDARGVSLVGGHTMRTTQLQVGFTVLGPVAGRLLPMAGLQPGDRLLLTRPLGSGVLLRAEMLGEARAEWLLAALAPMVQDPRPVLALLLEHGASAATDVTGFGLAGHLHSLLRASSSSVQLFLDQIPLLPGVEGLLRRGLRSTFHSQNFRLSRHFPGDAEDPRYQVLFDPQTAGGLLVGVPADRADALLLALRAGPAPEAAIIGTVSAAPGAVPGSTS